MVYKTLDTKMQQILIDVCNQAGIFLPVAQDPSWRYFERKVKGGFLWHYCWTTERSTYTGGNGKPAFLAFVIKWSGGHGKRVKTVAFSKRWKAKDRAYKWLCKAKGHAFKSLHNS